MMVSPLHEPIFLRPNKPIVPTAATPLTNYSLPSRRRHIGQPSCGLQTTARPGSLHLPPFRDTPSSLVSRTSPRSWGHP